MISPFDRLESVPAAGLPVRLLSSGFKGVSRLEFCLVEGHEVPAKIELGQASAEPESRLKEEVAELEEQLRSQATEMSMQMEVARSKAKMEADREWERRLEERLDEERAKVVNLSGKFDGERARYFAAVEAEVVKLALAVAARVLHREATLDPLLLAGVVRIALEKIADDSVSVLRVPMEDLQMWRDAFAAAPGSRLQVNGDDDFAAGECVLDTNVGCVELGVSAQLHEIERGFFDLLQQRPA